MSPLPCAPGDVCGFVRLTRVFLPILCMMEIFSRLLPTMTVRQIVEGIWAGRLCGVVNLIVVSIGSGPYGVNRGSANHGPSRPC